MKPKVILVIVALVAVTVAALFALDWYSRREVVRKRELANRLPAAAFEALQSDDRLVLFSLDPDLRNTGPEDNAFHGYRILGETVVNSPNSRQAMAETLKRALAAWERSFNGPVMCFMPRHGLRASHGGTTFEFVVCFECGRIHLYQGEGDPSSHEMEGAAGPFDELLAAAKIPKAP